MIACTECRGERYVEYTTDCPNDPAARVYTETCPRCGGNGAEPCVECAEDGTVRGKSGRIYCGLLCANAADDAPCICGGLGRIADAPCDHCAAGLPGVVNQPPSAETIRLSKLLASYVA